MYGIAEHKWKEILKVIFSNSKVRKVYLFGSRAIGTHHVGSDIDLAIDGPDMSLSDLNILSLSLDKLMLANRFDLILIHFIDNPNLLDHIRSCGVELTAVK